MKLFGRSSGYYLFWTGFVYFWAGMYLAFTHAARPEYATLGFVLALSVPLWCPPVARHFNMEPLMFDLFKKKTNVVQFPAIPKTEVKTPYTPPEPEKPVTTYYRLGITNNGRVSFQMGYSEITMNAGGIDNMIAQLEVFRDQITQYEDNGPEDDPDGGEPVPLPEEDIEAKAKKAA
jgi:hypothetical protein